MDDQREHPNPRGLEELMSIGLGPGRLIEAGDILKMQIEKATGFKVFVQDRNADFRLGVLVQDSDKQVVARFSLELFPGNHDIVVSTGAFVAENRRGVGIGWQMLKMRMLAAKKVGFQIYLATVAKDNKKEQDLMAKNGLIGASAPYLATDTAFFYYKRLQQELFPV